MKILFFLFSLSCFAQSVSCVFIFGTPIGTNGGTIPNKQILCVPSSFFIGPQGPIGPQGSTGPQGPAGSGSNFTGGPCTQPVSGVNLYAKLPDNSCLPIIAIPAANFIAANPINIKDGVLFKMGNYWKPLPNWKGWLSAQYPNPTNELLTMQLQVK